MPKNNSLKTIASVALSFTGFAVIVIVLMLRRTVSFQVAMLMLVALIGLYFGFGVLIAIYRFTMRLK
jgi:hypothetical protein